MLFFMKAKCFNENSIAEMLRFLKIIPFAALYAFGVAALIDPNDIAPGGVTGIAILVNRISEISIGTLIFVFNIPILILSFRKFGRAFSFRTIYCLGWISVFTNWFELMEPVTKEPILGALAGGCISGFSLGMILHLGATTGGLDIIVKVLRKKYPHMGTGSLFLTIDFMIVLSSVFVFASLDSVLYAMVTVFVSARVLDFVLYGKQEARMLHIVSDRAEMLAGRLMQELGVGITYLEGQGGYTKKNKRVIFCVVRKFQAPKAEVIVRETDENAFLIISNASEIYGEGYRDYWSDSL